MTTIHTLANVQLGEGSGRDHLGREVPMLIVGLTTDVRGGDGGQAVLPEVWMNVESALRLAEVLREHARRLAPGVAAAAELQPPRVVS